MLFTQSQVGLGGARTKVGVGGARRNICIWIRPVHLLARRLVFAGHLLARRLVFAGHLAPASEVTGHCGSSLDINFFLFFFFVSYVSLNLSDAFLRENKTENPSSPYPRALY
jgi:hypothetical protein